MNGLRVFVVAMVCCNVAFAQNYPTRPVTIVVPFSAGGPTDTIGRIMAERMTKTLGQTVVVENITGAGGNIGVGRVVRAAPDGYMVSIGHIGPHVINGAMYKLDYDLLKDLAPVGMFVTNPQVIVSKNGLPPKDLKSLIEYARSTPISIATGGAGTPSHISGVFFQKLTGGAAQIVHYRGGAPSLQGLLTGEIDLLIPQPPLVLSLVRDGKIRAYAVTSGARICGHADHTAIRRARHPDGRRSGHAGLLHGGVARTLGAGPHAARGHRAAQLGDGRSRSRRRRAQAPDGSWPGNPAQGQADAGSARCAPQSRDRKVVADHQVGRDQGRLVFQSGDAEQGYPVIA